MNLGASGLKRRPINKSKYRYQPLIEILGANAKAAKCERFIFPTAFSETLVFERTAKRRVPLGSVHRYLRAKHFETQENGSSESGRNRDSSRVIASNQVVSGSTLVCELLFMLASMAAGLATAAQTKS